jgi:hypothetical protein
MVEGFAAPAMVAITPHDACRTDGTTMANSNGDRRRDRRSRRRGFDDDDARPHGGGAG